MMGRRIMRIEYTCEDGSRTLALWPSMALQHWLGRSRPIRPIENLEPFTLYVVGPPVPGDDHLMFLRWLHAEGDITNLEVSEES
jgi:hypothetical protein